ncbi:hypothetical protein TNCV_2330501 [Trichonephila clavipes]|nr:hypothetical protein TNCV_2330501 [Trichonephila clavipes]
MKIGNNGNLVLGPFDESTPGLMIVLMNCQTKLRINQLTAVKSVAILEKSLEKRKPRLQEALDLLQNLPSEISDALTDDFSDEEVTANNLLGFSIDS